MREKVCQRIFEGFVDALFVLLKDLVPYQSCMAFGISKALLCSVRFQKPKFNALKKVWVQLCFAIEHTFLHSWESPTWFLCNSNFRAFFTVCVKWEKMARKFKLHKNHVGDSHNCRKACSKCLEFPYVFSCWKLSWV